MEDAKKFWLISVPKATQGEDEYSKMNRVTLEKSLSEGNYKFDIPTLRVGNMDTLVPYPSVISSPSSFYFSFLPPSTH